MSNWKVIVDEKNRPRWYAHSPRDMEYYKLHYIDNYEWEDEIQYCGYERGNSSCVMLFKSTLNGQTYHVFMTDFTDTIVDYMVNGKVSGTFTFCKRGTNYGIKLIKNC